MASSNNSGLLIAAIAGVAALIVAGRGSADGQVLGINLGADRSVQLNGASVSVTISYTTSGQPDAVTFSANPATVGISQPGANQVVLTFTAPGAYLITGTASKGVDQVDRVDIFPKVMGTFPKYDEVFPTADKEVDGDVQGFSIGTFEKLINIIKRIGGKGCEFKFRSTGNLKPVNIYMRHDHPCTIRACFMPAKCNVAEKP